MISRIICGLGIAFLMQSAAIAQKDDEAKELQALRQEIQKLRAGQNRIQKELGEIKLLLKGAQRRPAQVKFEPTVVDISGDPAKGQQNARVTLIDFTDYE